MNLSEIVQEKGASEGFRSWARNCRERDEIFHMTRESIATDALAEVQNSSGDPKMVWGCLNDIEDGFFKKFIEPEDLGLTWKSWRELCRTHNYAGLAKGIGTALKSLIKDEIPEDKSILSGNYRKIIDAEIELLAGNITLEDIEISPQEWSSLCKKYNYHSGYSFHCVPELFDNPAHHATYEVDKNHTLEVHLSGRVDADESGLPTPYFHVMGYIEKKASGKKHMLFEGEIEAMEYGVAKPEKIVDAIANDMLMEKAQIVIATRTFQAEVLQ